MAHQNSSASKFDLAVKTGVGMETCSVRLFPTAALRTSMIARGVCIPRPKKTGLRNLDNPRKISAAIIDGRTGTAAPQIIGGYLNTPSWHPLFE